MQTLKKIVANKLEELASDVLISTGCFLYWGETELPDCLRDEVTGDDDEAALVVRETKGRKTKF